MAVVKSNAYGHGLDQCVEILREKADWFGVNALPEALRVRESAPKTPVLVMGRQDERDYKLIPPGSAIALVVSSLQEIQALAEYNPGTPFHFKVDTGLGRLGADADHAPRVLEFLAERPELPWAGLMTHFANVEDVTDQEYALAQMKEFGRYRELAGKAAGSRKLLVHAAASAPAMLLPESRLDLVRCGIALYGLWPSRETRISLHAAPGPLPELRPVMRWVTRIAHLKTVPAGFGIGYGCTYRAQSETRLAVLPVGYFEGYERSLSNRSHVVIRGRRARLLGRVSMNMIAVDVSHIEQVAQGDEAVLIGVDEGESMSAEELAELTGTINYEVVTRVQGDLPRIVVE